MAQDRRVERTSAGMKAMCTKLKLVLFFSIAVWRVELGAQPLPALNVGSRVRVVGADERGSRRIVTGSLVRLSGDTAVIAAHANAAESFVLGSSQRLEVVSGSRSQAARGALYGMLLGGATLGLITLISYDPCEPTPGTLDFLKCTTDFGRGAYAGIAFAGGALVGAGIGAIVGGTSRKEVWTPVTTAGVRVGLFARPRVAGFGLQLTFE